MFIIRLYFDKYLTFLLVTYFIVIFANIVQCYVVNETGIWYCGKKWFISVLPNPLSFGTIMFNTY